MTDEELRDAARRILGDAPFQTTTHGVDAIVALARRFAESQRTAALALAGKWRDCAALIEAYPKTYLVATEVTVRACADELAALFPEVTRG